MKDVKFTTDGKKVVVIGNLNSNEKIVQEIFVTKEGAEIPSGENFVVKSLHDNPVKAWKEKEIEKIENRYNDYKSLVEKEQHALKESHRRLRDELLEKNRYLRKYIDNSSKESFDILQAFLNDDDIFYVRDGYSPDIVTRQDISCSYDRDKLKLISLFGRDDGSLQWGIHHYSDGSGGSSDFYPFLNIDDAKEKFISIIDKLKCWNDSIVKICEKYNIPKNKKKIELDKEKRLSDLNSSLSYKQKEIDKIKSRIKDLK